MDNDNQHPAQQLQKFVKALRDPEKGIVWDRAQTFESFSRYTLDETYELIAAIDKKDIKNIKEELGDLLFHIMFYAQIADEQQLFNYIDIVNAVNDKILRRYEPIFGNENLKTPEQVEKLWKQIKAEEKKKNPQPLPGPQNADLGAQALPALMRATNIIKCAEEDKMIVSLDAEFVIEKVKEELDEIVTAEGAAHREEEIGDALFALATLGRHYKVDPERALQKANAKFMRRWQGMFEIAQAKGQTLADLDDKTLDKYWNQVKKKEKSGR